MKYNEYIMERKSNLQAEESFIKSKLVYEDIPSHLLGDTPLVFKLLRSEQRKSFDFAAHFIMLLWMRNPIAIRSTIFESEGCNP